MSDSDLKIFCRQVRKRSQENREALCLLHRNALLGPAISILRQELDSLVRCIFLLAQNKRYREQLIHDSAIGNPWRKKNGKGRVTDKDMVDLTMSHTLHGWTRSVYKFGCGFIHLSALHDYSVRDPFDMLSAEERRDIADHVRSYHHVEITASTKLREIEFVLPAVFTKISDNLECYVIELEDGSDGP